MHSAGSGGLSGGQKLNCGGSYSATAQSEQFRKPIFLDCYFLNPLKSVLFVARSRAFCPVRRSIGRSKATFALCITRDGRYSVLEKHSFHNYCIWFN